MAFEIHVKGTRSKRKKLLKQVEKIYVLTPKGRKALNNL